jgi:hypothetical protein
VSKRCRDDIKNNPFEVKTGSYEDMMTFHTYEIECHVCGVYRIFDDFNPNYPNVMGIVEDNDVTM